MICRRDWGARSDPWRWAVGAIYRRNGWQTIWGGGCSGIRRLAGSIGNLGRCGPEAIFSPPQQINTPTPPHTYFLGFQQQQQQQRVLIKPAPGVACGIREPGWSMVEDKGWWGTKNSLVPGEGQVGKIQLVLGASAWPFPALGLCR